MNPRPSTPLISAWRGAWFEALLVFLVFLVAGGDPAPHRNEAHYLARLKHYWAPEWCSGDFFLETPDAHFTVVWLFGWVATLLSLEATAWAGRVLTWGLLAWGWERLCRRVTSMRGAAPLSAAIFVVLTEQTHLAGEWVIGGFEAKGVAYGFVLHALAELLDDRWNRAWGLLGIASAFHALVGGWSVVALLLAWTLLGSNRPALSRMTPGLVSGGFVSLLGVVPALMLNRGVDPETIAQAHQIYVFDRLPHHLAPLSMRLSFLSWRVLRFLIGLGVMALLCRKVFGPGGQSWPVERPEALRRLVLFAVGSLTIAAAGFAVQVALWNRPENAAAILRYYFFRLADVAPAFASSLMVVAAIAKMSPRRAAGASAVCVAACLWWVGGYLPPRLSSPSPPADAKMHEQAAWREMCAWVENNTKPESLFLVPRMSHTFKWRSGRPEVVTYKDVPQNAEGLVEWKRRFLDVYRIGELPNGQPRWADSLAALGGVRLRELAEAYSADYALDQAPRWAPRRRASLPVVHRVGPYTLYDLQDRDPDVE